MTRPLGIAHNIEELQYLFRLRAEQLDISRETIDDLCCFPSGYAARLLQPLPEKRPGPDAINELMRTLAVKFVVIEDATALARTLRRGTKRQKKQVRNGSMLRSTVQRALRKIQAKGGMNSRKNMSKAQAVALARRAAQIRWANRAQDIA